MNLTSSASCSTIRARDDRRIGIKQLGRCSCDSMIAAGSSTDSKYNATSRRSGAGILSSNVDVDELDHAEQKKEGEKGRFRGRSSSQGRYREKIPLRESDSGGDSAGLAGGSGGRSEDGEEEEEGAEEDRAAGNIPRSGGYWAGNLPRSGDQQRRGQKNLLGADDDDISVVKAVEVWSSDPGRDFKESMAEMLSIMMSMATGSGGEYSPGTEYSPAAEYSPCAEYSTAVAIELLQCYLALNPSALHGLIVSAFADVWSDLHRPSTGYRRSIRYN